MALGTAIALAGLALGAIGTHIQIEGQKKTSAASIRAEAARKQIANLETLRNRRQRIKEALFARSESISTASNQGAIASSSLQASLFQTTSQLGRNLSAGAQNQFLGNTIFDEQANIASGRALFAGGAGLQGFGTSLFNASSSPFFNQPQGAQA